MKFAVCPVMNSKMVHATLLAFCFLLCSLNCLELVIGATSEPFRRDPGHPQWHHSAFQDIADNVKHEMRQLLHSRAQIPFRVPLEVNIVLVGFNGDGGYRYSLDAQKLGDFMKKIFPSHRPSCTETALQIDIEHNLFYNVIPVGQPELIAFEQAVKNNMLPVGSMREAETRREVPLYEVEAMKLEAIFNRLYTYLFDYEAGTYSAMEINKPVPKAIFILNFDKLRMDPKSISQAGNEAIYTKIVELDLEDLKKQEGGYVYHYRYNGGSATQVWLSSGRYAVIDLSAGPCIYGRIETEEGSVDYKTIPRLQYLLFPRNRKPVKPSLSQDTFTGQLSSLIVTTIEYVIAPDVRFETIDPASRLLVPIIVLQNHQKYNLFEPGHNYTIDVQAIRKEVVKMVQPLQDVVVVGGSHNLHEHEKLAVAVLKALRGQSIYETGKYGHFQTKTRTYLDGAILQDEMRHSSDVLAAGLLEASDPASLSKYFGTKHWPGRNSSEMTGSIVRNKPFWTILIPKSQEKRRKMRKLPHVYRSYGTRVIPVFVLSLMGVDSELMMEGESLFWASQESVFVLQHEKNSIPLSYVSETRRRELQPMSPQRHILASIASALGGLVAPYEKASHIHKRPLLNWLWASGCHPFGPFSNHSGISQLMSDNAIRNAIYARVDKTLKTVREITESIQSFANDYLRTPLGEPTRGQPIKSTAEMWLDMFYQKKTNIPPPLPHDLVDHLEAYLDKLEEKLVQLSAMLYDHRLQEAHQNSSDILQSARLNQQYVDQVLLLKRVHMNCCKFEFVAPIQSSQAFFYGEILVAGFIIYFLVIFFLSRRR